jgi:hypothetical protein
MVSHPRKSQAQRPSVFNATTRRCDDAFAGDTEFQKLALRTPMVPTMKQRPKDAKITWHLGSDRFVASLR